MEIIDAGIDLLDAIAALEIRAFTVPWSRKTFEGAFASDNISIFAAVEGDVLLGFACLLCIGADGELLNIAVDEAYRGRGVGSALMDALMERAESRAVETVFLEVRESNAPARHLYGKYGFAEIGKRKRYYQKPEEDAVLMQCTMQNA